MDCEQRWHFSQLFPQTSMFLSPPARLFAAPPESSGRQPGPCSRGCGPRSRSFASAWQRLPRPQCAGGRTRRIYRPRPTQSSSGREGGGCPDPSGRDQAWGRGSGLARASGNAGHNFKMRLWDLWLRVNCYYPPDDGFLAANGKKLLHEVIGRVFSSASSLRRRQNYECF